MSGWKTYVGAALTFLAGGLIAIGEYDYAGVVVSVGVALGFGGMRAKLERMQADKKKTS